MTMQQIVRQFQDEVMEAHLRKLRAENEEYQEIERELLRLAHKVQEYMETLSDSQQKSLWITVIPGIVKNRYKGKYGGGDICHLCCRYCLTFY